MSARIDTTRAAAIVMVCGGSGSGKSAWTKQQVARAARLIVWDVDDEYGDAGCKRVTRASELLALLRSAGKSKPARVAYVAPPTAAAFDYWARCVLAWGNCTAVAEELATVTNPGKAPPGWGSLVSRGRKYGIKIVGVTQRPSEADKTIMGNATLIHVGRMTRAGDRAYMAREMDIPQADIDRLKTLEYIERNAGGGIKRGRVTFPKAKKTTA